MKCEKCGSREAEVHIRHQKGKDIADFHLCRQCAEIMAKEGIIPDISFDIPIDSFLWGLFPAHGIPATGHAGDEAVRAEVTCSRCGLDSGYFRKAGKYGCPECFSVFRDYLGPLLRKIHGSEIHRGVRPKTACIEVSCSDEIELLRKELLEAVEKEDYERAAVIRDRIREIGETDENRG